jgi:hypothetical protein
MNEWNKLVVDESAINKLKENINGLLSSSFYYGLATTKNNRPSNAPDEVKLTEQYGKYYYDYSMAITSPLVLHQVSQENVDKSTSLVSTAEVQPLYNFYDKDFETVAANNPEQTLYNYYALYYYLLENLDNPTKEKFLNQNVLPLLTKYKSFIDSYLASNTDKDNIKDKLKAYKETNPLPISKNTIAVLPDALKVINDTDTKKAEQPFGIDISFPPQPRKTIGNLIGSTSAAVDIESLVSSNASNNTLESKAYVAELFYNNQNNLSTEEYKKIPVISLNEWIKKVEPTKNTLTNNETIVFTKNESDKDSIFLQKIKKVLLQKKIDSLIQDNKRTFADIIAGVPAYNEILLFEIKKYNYLNQPIQSILIPNTEDLDFYKYFDTQIKYDTTYSYEVIAWTFIIGNKYKYFDRIEIPKKATYKLKNNTSTDSEYFRWFRVVHAMSALYNNTTDQNGAIEFFKSNEDNAFGGVSDNSAGIKVNLSRLLTQSYTNNSPTSINAEYINAVNNKDNVQTINELINTVKNNFISLIKRLLSKNKINTSDAVNALIQYQTFNKPSSGISADILGSSLNINSASNYYSSLLDVYAGSEIINKILQILVKVNIFKNLDFDYINKKIAEISDPTRPAKAIASNNDLENYLKDNFIVQTNKFLEGGFNATVSEVDLSKDPNYGLNVDSDYYPRFYTKKDNSNKFKLSGQLQFGVLNEVDIVLAGLPYMQKTPARVISSPPPPPEVSIIPYKNVANRIKFFLTDSSFTYRDYPIYMTEQDTQLFNKSLEYEKARNLNDGKITFRGDEPSALFGIYRLEEKPKLYSDFIKGKTYLASPLGGGFEDQIEPNKKYYYTFRSADNHGMLSNPSAIYEIEIVENSGAIYPIINIVDLEKEDPRIKTLSFKEQFKINVNNEHILENESNKINSALSIKGNNFGSLTPSLFGRNFKIRITSKTTKKKMDINLSFDKSLDFKNVIALIESLKKQAQEKGKKVKA